MCNSKRKGEKEGRKKVTKLTRKLFLLHVKKASHQLKPNKVKSHGVGGTSRPDPIAPHSLGSRGIPKVKSLVNHSALRA